MVPQLPLVSSYGEVLKVSRINGFLLSETAYRPNQRISRHSHELAYFYAVVEGAYAETLGSTTMDRKPFAAAFRPAGEVHSHCCGPLRGRCFNVAVQGTRVECVRSYSGALVEPAEVHGPVAQWLMARLYREFYSNDSLAPLAIESLGVEMLVEASRQRATLNEGGWPRWLVKAKELLRERFTDRLTLDDIASVVGVHPIHLARVFRKRCGSTVGEYVRQLRIDSACRQLATSNTPLAELALATGFSDQSEFSKCFKRHIGMTPRDFRAACRPR
jgi:AraC family transcriptional regulator